MPMAGDRIAAARRFNHEIGMLSSLLPNNFDLVRITRCGLTTSLVGKKKFPWVHREAVNVSAGEESIGLSIAAFI